MDVIKKCRKYFSSETVAKTIFYLAGLVFTVYSFGLKVSLLIVLFFASGIAFGLFFDSIYWLIRDKRESTIYPVSKWIYKLIASVICIVLLLVFTDIEILIYALLIGIVILVVPLIFASKWVD